MSKRELIDYEIGASSWWVDFVPADSWLGTLAAKYFARKVNRKYARYEYTVRRRAFFERLKKEMN